MSWLDHILDTSLFVKLFIGKLFTLLCMAANDEIVFKGLYPFEAVTFCNPGITFPPERPGWLIICTGEGVFLFSRSITTDGMFEILDKCDGIDWLWCNPWLVTGLDIYGLLITWMVPGWLILDWLLTILEDTEPVWPKVLFSLKFTSLMGLGICITFCRPEFESITDVFILWLNTELDCVCDNGWRFEECVTVGAAVCIPFTDCDPEPLCITWSPLAERTMILCPPFVGAGVFPPIWKDLLCVTLPSGPIRFTVIIFVLFGSPVWADCCLSICGSWDTISPPFAGNLITAGDDDDLWNDEPGDGPGVSVELWNKFY